MIRVEELMIGDWVNIMVEGYDNPTQIKEIGPFWVKVTQDEKDYGIVLIEPIPITPEILEKNGFYWGYPVDVEEMASNVFGGIGIEMPPKSWVWDEGDGVVSVIFPNESDGGMITCYLDKHLTLVFDDMFVHELQHALKLCGINKNIEL